jgi:hypothetical protein
VFGVIAIAGVTTYIFYNRKPSAEEIERQRREFLAERGRITDATLVDVVLDGRNDAGSEVEFVTGGALEETPPEVLRYQYKVGGVGYESLQDVARLAEFVKHVRVDLPIQVRYDPKNPGNSIVVAESWSGLRNGLTAGGEEVLQQQIRSRE